LMEVTFSAPALNAFFVRNDLVEEKFQRPFSAQNHYNCKDFLWPYLGRGHAADWGRWVRVPNPIDQNPWAHWRSPMDMMRQG
jgi:hypothetical protein